MSHTKPYGVHIRPSGQKTFIPLENNPVVFTKLIQTLGLSPYLAFNDIYSLSDLSLIHRPAHALMLMAPAPIYHAVRAHDPGSAELNYDGFGSEEPVTWFRQTIGHACGLIALIHGIANGAAKSFIRPGSLIDNTLKESEPLKPPARAKVLYASQELEYAHMAAAREGDSVAPESSEAGGYHFIAFIKGKDGRRLWELEGGRSRPIERGVLDEGEDVLSPRAPELGVGRFLKVAKEMDNVEFSVIALAEVIEE